MGYKAIKDHYKIKHIVQVVRLDEPIPTSYLYIGSSMVSELVKINTLDFTFTEHETFNNFLARQYPDFYHDLMHDNDKIRTLWQQKDTFAAAYPVYRFNEKNNQLEQKFCETLGWPNTTHDGSLMYENVYFQDPAKCLLRAYQNIQLDLRYKTDQRRNLIQEIATLEKTIETSYLTQDSIEQLLNDYPEAKAHLKPNNY